MAIPAAPTIDGNLDPRCVERERPAETAEDDAFIAQGLCVQYRDRPIHDRGRAGRAGTESGPTVIAAGWL